MTGVVAVVLGILGYSFYVASVPKPAENNCLAEIHESTVFVIDHSEGITDQTIDEISARAMAFVRDRVSLYGWVSVFRIVADSKKALRPVFSGCRPASTGNRLTENIKNIERRYKETFLEPLTRAISERPTVSDESPIAQALTDLSLSEFLRKPSNRLVVFSDLLENTPAFSLYGCTSGPEAVQAYRRSRSGSQERPAFRDTEIFLNIIPRLQLSPESTQCRAHFWTWFVGDNEGSAASGATFDYLPGGSIK